MAKEKRDTRRNIFKWLFVLLAGHVLSAILYQVALNRMVTELASDNYISRANAIVLVYGIAFTLILCVWYALNMSRYTEFRDALKNAMREKNFNLVSYFKKNFILVNIYRGCVYLALQLPFVIFFAIFGFSPQYITIVEKIYITEAGMYELVGVSFAAAIVMSVLLVAFLLITQLVFLFVNYRYILENSPSLSKMQEDK